ncbi:methyltransferase regulatory domain-containing protein [Fusobacterium polymorphum]|uniref:Methyltransferase n=1 Tax=Fusobacterium nucleatum subsp. polymorphum TaxID=76857 RepID=A0A2C6A8F3_FUSNP|nr:class I SAM-dependent methyltransferase [Fusobacterium polymorphum]PHI08020.1 methyltransferase [Fusobacterium polymorphum]
MVNKETIENVKAVQKSYDEAPYKSKTFYYTQPGRQQMVLKLLGFKTPDLEKARVLEIGCSFGGNIIPFALENPKAEVIGVDLSSVQIEEGNRIIEYLGLENIRLIHQNVLEFDKKFGKFDYIICHGVFSWVNEEVQRGILNVIKNHLSENGSAILSYNTYPGWKNLEVARDVMLFRDEMLKNRGEQINEGNAVKYGRGAIEFLSQFSVLNEKIKAGITDITEKDDYYILHEYFEENNKPMYLYDFSKMLLEHDLIHVVDSDLMKTFPNISEEIEQKLTAECGDDNIAKEQYYDFLLDRQFRVSVVTHKANKEKINISKDIRIVDLKEINLRGKYEKDKDGFYTIENNKIEDEEVNLILGILSENYPNTITIDELEKKVKERMKKETNNVYANAVYLMYGKLVEGYSNKLTVKKEEKINLNPKYKNYLNYFITNPNHAIALASYQGTINYDSINPVMLSIITLFDGTRTDEDIFNLLVEKERAGEIAITFEESSSKEEVIRNNIEICRNFVEINFLNK